ncbi:MAG: hypothetical protein A2Z97_14895 [Bdellovibrionales bacterium GWB1_52_6]|nr:MAG: hypothetical protein A2Z97_14895 [Bdellovibrionales bacterium GWB1_52_6]
MENEWQSEKIFHEGDSFFAGLAQDIAQAQKSIELEAYIFNDDALGHRISTALSDAARRGLRVRVMVDGVGSASWALKILPELAAAGVQTKVYHPLPWIFWSFSLIWRRGLSGMLAFFRRVNRRNHRKLCILDHHRAWVGSMNISSSHLREFSGEGVWRDTGVCVEGAAVLYLEAAFEKAWRKARGPLQGVQREFFQWTGVDKGRWPKLIRLNDRRSRRKYYSRELLVRIGQAKRRVWLTTPYFVPSGPLIRALRTAAERDIDVRILVPRKPDLFFMKWVSTAFYSSLISSGVRFFEYLPSVLHAKTAVIDDWATVGSSNFNHRSLLHDLEVDVVVHQPESLVELENHFGSRSFLI